MLKNNNMENGLNNIFAYSKLSLDKNLPKVSVPKVLAHIPTITDNDYLNGYIERYFVQKVNDINAPIEEINSNDINEITSSRYYTVTNLTWRLIGTPQQIMDSNSQSVKEASKIIPNISYYLSNLLQFAKIK
jgi:hypothetical protein